MGAKGLTPSYLVQCTETVFIGFTPATYMYVKRFRIALTQLPKSNENSDVGLLVDNKTRYVLSYSFFFSLVNSALIQ